MNYGNLFAVFVSKGILLSLMGLRIVQVCAFFAHADGIVAKGLDDCGRQRHVDQSIRTGVGYVFYPSEDQINGNAETSQHDKEIEYAQTGDHNADSIDPNEMREEFFK